MKRAGSLAFLAFLAIAAPAHASFPGENGKIVFSRPSATCNPTLYTINPDGSGDARVTNDPAGDGLNPSWSPDGQRLAFEASTQCPDQPGTHKEIYVVNADGSGRTRMTNDSVYDAEPTWSPTGNRIAWVKTRLTPNADCTESIDLAAMNTDFTSPQYLTRDSHFESQPDWGPGDVGLSYWLREFFVVDETCEGFLGRDLLITHRGEFEFFNPQADHSPDGWPFVLRTGDDVVVYTGFDDPVSTNTPGIFETNPVWSPNGALIAYLREGDIWVMNSDGSNQHPITSTPEQEGPPDWQPVRMPHVRPAGATPFRVPLVPAFEPCDSFYENRTHGPPLAYGSCAPPRPKSTRLTAGVGDGDPALARSVGFMRIAVHPGPPGGVDDTDVAIRLRLSNVMRTADLSEYTGELQAKVTVRLTDRNGGVSQTIQEWPESNFELRFSVPCAPTVEPLDKSLCETATTLDAVMPGAAAEGDRALWALHQVRVFDGGPDEDGDTEDNSLFAVQGVFVP